MVKYLLFSLITASLLTGCASSGIDTASVEPQYCYTDEKIVYDKNNQVVSNDTVVECSDKPKVRHFVKDAGIAKKCRPYQTVANIRGTQKNVQGFLCQFPDGSWQAVDGRYRY